MNKHSLAALEDFIFVQHEPAPADILFIPGNGHAEPSERAAALYRAGFAPRILPSGRFSIQKSAFAGQTSGKRAYPGAFLTEWEFMRGVLLANGVPDFAILREARAAFTWQNAICSRAAADAAGLRVRRALLCCMPVHARRCLLYYSSVFPEAEILVCPAEGCQVTRETWAKTPEGIDAVLGEIERCGAQFREIAKEKLLHPTPFPSPLERAYAPPGALGKEVSGQQPDRNPKPGKAG